MSQSTWNNIALIFLDGLKQAQVPDGYFLLSGTNLTWTGTTTLIPGDVVEIVYFSLITNQCGSGVDSRRVDTIAPLHGGGDLSTNLTLTIDMADTVHPGTIIIRNDLGGTASSPEVHSMTLNGVLKLAALDGYIEINVPSILFANNVTPIITQADSVAFNGADMFIQAQTGSPGFDGGDLLLIGGLAGVGGTAGTIRLNVGGFTGLTVETGGAGTFGQVQISNGFALVLNDTVDIPAFISNGKVFVNNSFETVGSIEDGGSLDVYAGGFVPTFTVDASSVTHLSSASGESHIQRLAGFTVKEDGYWGRTNTSAVTPFNIDIESVIFSIGIDDNNAYTVIYDIQAKYSTIIRYMVMFIKISGTLTVQTQGAIFNPSSVVLNASVPDNNTMRLTVTPLSINPTQWTVFAKIIEA